MLAVARREHPGLTWLLADLADLSPDDPALGGRFDLVLAAGNVVPLLAEGALPRDGRGPRRPARARRDCSSPGSGSTAATCHPAAR